MTAAMFRRAVTARTSLTVDAGGRLAALDCQPPLTIRQVRTDDPDVCALCLVGTTAGPLPGDDFRLSIAVRAGARASLEATGAGIVQGGLPASRMDVEVTVGDGGALAADPGPLIVCAGSRVDVSLRVDLAADSAINWRETVVLGRTGERPGTATLRWDIVRAGQPVLRQIVDLAEPATAAWPGLLAGRRVLASAVLSSSGLAARTVVRSPTAVAQRVDARTVLVTVLGTDAATARADLDALCETISGPNRESGTASAHRS